MRTCHKITIGLVLVCTLLGFGFPLFAFGDHIRDLVEVLRTYATFDLLELNLYTYPPNEKEKELARQFPQLAPKILHQILLREGRNSSLAKYEPARQSCISVHEDWEYMLWTDDNATAFVSTNYPDVVPHYMNYAQTIQRTNILRYLLLHHYGGVYLDVDITCRVPLDTLLYLPFVTPGAHPAGINNAFILTRPQHPFLEEVIARIPSRDIPWPMPYVENMLTTGCMFITNAWMEYIRHIEDADWQDKVFVLAGERGDIASHMLRGEVTTPLFKHGGASSWHSWDAEVIVFIGACGKKSLFLIGILVLILVCPMVALRLRRRAWRMHRRRQSGQDEEKACERKSHSH